MKADATFRIRPSTPGEGGRAVEIWRAAVDATHDFLSVQDRAAIEAEVQGFLPQLPLWFCVDADDRPVGFMALGDQSLDALFIDPLFRGQGVGRRLVRHALAAHGEITTEVNAQNLQAVGFYRRLGFVETGRSATDGQGRPYPLIRMRCGSPVGAI